MKTKLSSLETTEAELEYRTKQYHVLRALKQRELSCGSCGNVLGHESSEIFEHPVFGILQCRKCNEHAKKTLASDETPVSCLICAGTRKNLYKCERKSCSYKFCQACIKRNVPQSLAEAESKKWKCLVCNSKPLWKLRGTCAVVMKSISKRTKRKKVSGHRSSDAEGDKTDLKNISYVRRRRLNETKKLSKRLRTVCDQDSPTETERLENPRNKVETKGEKSDGNKKSEGRFGYESNASREQKMMPTSTTTDDDSDIQEIKSSRYKKTSKPSNSRDASAETRRKRVGEARKDSTREKVYGRRKNSASSRKSSCSNFDSAESDESETEERSTAGTKRKQRSDNKISVAKKKYSSEQDDSEDEDKRTRKRRRNESTYDRGKKSSAREAKKSAKTSNVDEDSNGSSTETGSSAKNVSNKRNGGARKSRDDERSRKSRRDENSSEKNANSDEAAATMARSLRDENDKMDGKSKKTLDHRRVENQRFASDSSSGKEFCKTKLCRNSFVSLRRIAELDEDRTRTPDGSPEPPRDLISKDQTFALKNTVANFYAELKRAANKLVNDIEFAQTNYCKKDAMRPTDVDRLILETKNVVTKLKRCVDHGEDKIDDYYDKWCRKTRVRNVLKTRRTSDENEDASTSRRGTKRSPAKRDDSEKEASLRTSPSRKNRDRSAGETSDVGPTTNITVVSDCNSDEIFSGDETRNSTRKSHPSSPTRRDSEKSPEPVDDEISTRTKVVSSDDERPDEVVPSDDERPDEVVPSDDERPDEVVPSDDERPDEVVPSDDERPDEVVPSKPASDCDPAPFDNETCEISSDSPTAENARELPEKSILSGTLVTGRDSVDPSDVDIFEATIESSEESSPNKSGAPISDSERASSTKESSRSARSRTEAKVSSRRESETDSSAKPNGRSDSRRTTVDSKPEVDSDEESVKDAFVECPYILDPPVGDDARSLSENDDVPRLPADNENSESLDSAQKRLSKSKDHQGEKDTEEIDGSPLNADKSDECEGRSREEETSTKDSLERSRNEENESIHSMDTVVGEVSDDKSPRERSFAENDAEEALTDALITNFEASEKDGSKSPSPRKTPTPDILSDERVEHARDSRSPSDVDRAVSPVTAMRNERTDDAVSRSSSPISRDSVKTSLDNNDDLGRRSENDGSRHRSSEETLIADDLTTEESAAKLRLSHSSRSSTPSESEDRRARDMLLLSSNSDESSVEDSSTLPNSGTIENEDAPPTPPESDSNGPKSTTRDRSEAEPDGVERSPKTRRKKFRIQNYPHLMADKRLRQRCEIRLIRLKERVLRRYARALKKSRDYVDSKELKSLVSLDKLEKKNKSGKNSDDKSDDDSTSGNLRNKKKTRGEKKREETLLDHLERVRNGKTGEESSEQSESDRSDRPEESRRDKPDDCAEERLFDEADRMAKKRLLESSDSGGEGPSASETQENVDAEKKEKKPKKAAKKDKSDETPEEQDKDSEKAEKSRWRKNKILTLKISDSDSEEDEKKFNSSQKKLAEKNKNKGSDSDSEVDETPKKKRVRRRVLHSDSDVEVSQPSDSEKSDDDTDQKKKKKKKKKGSSDEEAKKKTRKRIRRGNRSSSSSDSLDEKRPKNRRKRIKTAASDSDSDIENSQGTPGKAGRKNIRKVIRDKQVADDTKQAAKDEEERLQRIAERQKLYNQMYENRLAGETKVDKLVLDFDEETQEPLISVNEDLVKRLKPHQAQGIKFMWDACFESLERAKTTKGSGCILAHCMGLGKSFQVVALSHTLLQHEKSGVKTVMVVCPLSTVLNWVNEFKMWLENLEDGDDIEVYELTRMKKNFERKYQLQRWQKTGGVLIIGYEMFRNLSNATKKVRKNIQEAFVKCLVDPGADLIVCDEGHLLKNEDTALSKAMRRVRTLRRIVLTGTPLQNNLIEYHCMVQFVKPNLLGTKKEFTNRFENPITNGQFDDSTEYDVRLMKKRAHVLHKMLEGSVQRLDYSVLTPFLPPKQEYVIFVKLTEVQISMYRYYLDNYARRHRGVGGSLFADFQALQRIWTHPLVMQMNQRKVELANEKKRLDATDSEGSLRDFIDDNSDSDSSDSSEPRSASGSDDEAAKKPTRVTRSCPEPEDSTTNQEKSEEAATTNDELEWWTQFVKEDDYEDMRISSKLLLLFSILKESHSIGDKVLVFSQSLYSLTLIEEFLRLIDDATQSGSDEPENLDGHSGSWCLGLDYFRLDGQTTTDNRRRWCDIFNRPSNTRARLFLISTRAGGLGINLTAANRVIIFDASWNPSHDVQSIFRIYRFGQKKPCYVYRLLAAGTMEEKIYNRQVTKLSLSCRVVDEQQIERHYTNNALAELYKLEISEGEQTLNLPKDRLLAEIFLKYKHCVENYHEHDSLLENQTGEELDEEERQQAWLEYEEEKKGKRMLPQGPFVSYQNEILMQQMNLINMAQQTPTITNPAMMLDYENLKKMMSKDYPGVSEAQQKAMAERAVYEMYNYVERQAMAHQNPMGIMASLGYDNRMGQPQPILQSHPTPDMIRAYQQSLVQQQNGQMNYPMNQVSMIDPTGHIRNQSIVQKSQLTAQPLATSSSSNVDDDIVEIPSSPEKNLVAPAPAPGGSRKSQEE